MVLWKEPHGRRITNVVHIDPIDFDMFKLDSDDAYVSLQVPKSIDESMQPIVTMGGSIIVVGDLVVGNVPTRGVDNGTNSLKEYATTFDMIIKYGNHAQTFRTLISYNIYTHFPFMISFELRLVSQNVFKYFFNNYYLCGKFIIILT